MNDICDGCGILIEDWCFIHFKKLDDYKQNCPCRECIIKSVCSKWCQVRIDYTRSVRLDYIQKIPR